MLPRLLCHGYSMGLSCGPTLTNIPRRGSHRIGQVAAIWVPLKLQVAGMATGPSTISLFLVGDVMLARGIDQSLRFHCDPKLYEGNGLCARDYVHLAVMKNGKLPDAKTRGPGYVWGDALQILNDKKPDLRIINLENSVTTSEANWPSKGIHYRMHPENVNVIQAADIDCCVLANNHTIDWGYKGLEETLATLRKARLTYAGAGYNIGEATAPAVYHISGHKGRVLVFAGGHYSSGIPEEWKADTKQPGVNVWDLQSSKGVAQVKEQIKLYRKDKDIVIVSVHWGGNWGYAVEQFRRNFAHSVINECKVDLVHGHSSHHAMGVEVYKGKLIIYGCGDFINDYEGIDGREEYRGDLSLMYFANIDSSSGNLTGLEMVPTQIRQLQIHHASDQDVDWMCKTMSRECKKLGCDVRKNGNELTLVHH